MTDENPRIFISAEKWELRHQIKEIAVLCRDLMIKAVAEMVAKKLAFIVIGEYAWSRGKSPSTRYKIAGNPYGKNRAGKKRWVHEMRKWKDSEIANIVKDANAQT